MFDYLVKDLHSKLSEYSRVGADMADSVERGPEWQSSAQVRRKVRTDLVNQESVLITTGRLGRRGIRRLLFLSVLANSKKQAEVGPIRQALQLVCPDPRISPEGLLRQMGGRDRQHQIPQYGCRGQMDF